MSDNSQNNKRIAKNTMFLYIRMLIMMLIGLYTSRVNLQALGVESYGIYNVVGGFVAMFSIMSSSISTAISRYITYELGRENMEKLKTIFSTSVNIQILISIAIIIIAEIFGPWFIETQLNIPTEFKTAAQWVFQFSILTFVLNLISVPYTAAIIAHEKMSAFAYISIFEALGKLFVAILITIASENRLIIYAALICLIGLIVRFIYGYYCKKHFVECKYVFVVDKSLFKEIGKFAGWSFFGNTAYIFNTQGVNMLINMFFGVTLNAARGIAVSLDNIVNQFTTNITLAFNPQITKSYAVGNNAYMNILIRRSTKFSFFLMLILIIPIIIETPYILKLWLLNVPEYSTELLRLTLISSMFSMIGGPLLTGIQASGNIKRYQIVVTLFGFTVFPLTYLFFKLGYPVESTYYVYILIYGLLIFVRIFMARSIIKFELLPYIKDVIFKIPFVGMLSFLPPFLLAGTMCESILRLFLTTIVSVTNSIIIIYFIGLDKNEKLFFQTKILQVIKKIRN